MGDDNKEWSCCNDEQSMFIFFYIAFVAVALLTWKTIVAKPMRLMAVFLHEMSHATACWITGGEVKQLAVYQNEGGVTRYIGGSRCMIIPAGYVGTSIWAMVFVIMSGGRISATIAAIILTIALLIALCFAPNRTMVMLNMGYAVLTMGILAIEWFVYTPVVQFLILFYGVTVGIFAIVDVYEDTVVRTVEGSDAYACYMEVSGCCHPQCVGMQWALLTIIFQGLGIWLALVEMSEECQDAGWLECINMSVEWGDWGKDWNFDGFWDNVNR
uniref:Peptidase M50B-like-domain-containing protein n=1 Tax=Grammatophora oceanica TaxID=210454 RepID=A0A7S1UMM4_9STRA|mmetsp:Transcript_12075/g.17703  ORF Transcript_12075/g.17703 Transcript_12075/m.17703 type:complete len:271 (+) Transcript_12075:32-844(+)